MEFYGYYYQESDDNLSTIYIKEKSWFKKMKVLINKMATIFDTCNIDQTIFPITVNTEVGIRQNSEVKFGVYPNNYPRRNSVNSNCDSNTLTILQNDREKIINSFEVGCCGLRLCYFKKSYTQ